jgi:pentatricopeptide repeat protein
MFRIFWAVFGGSWYRMRVLHIRPDIISYGSITHACGASGQWERALFFFQDLRALGSMLAHCDVTLVLGDAR